MRGAHGAEIEINWLLSQDLIERSAGACRPRSDRTLSFLPPGADPAP